ATARAATCSAARAARARRSPTRGRSPGCPMPANRPPAGTFRSRRARTAARCSWISRRAAPRRASSGRSTTRSRFPRLRPPERLLVTRTRAGEQLRAIDARERLLEGGEIEASGRLSGLVDVDYASAITRFQQNQTALEAAMATYSKVARLSLFDYL